MAFIKKKYILIMIIIIGILLYHYKIKGKEDYTKKSFKNISENKKSLIFLSLQLRQLKRIKDEIENINNKKYNLKNKLETKSELDTKLIAQYLKNPEEINFKIHKIENEIQKIKKKNE